MEEICITLEELKTYFARMQDDEKHTAPADRTRLMARIRTVVDKLCLRCEIMASRSETEQEFFKRTVMSAKECIWAACDGTLDEAVVARLEMLYGRS